MNRSKRTQKHRKRNYEFEHDAEHARQWKWRFLRSNKEYRQQYETVRPLLEEAQRKGAIDALLPIFEYFSNHWGVVYPTDPNDPNADPPFATPSPVWCVSEERAFLKKLVNSLYGSERQEEEEAEEESSIVTMRVNLTYSRKDLIEAFRKQVDQLKAKGPGEEVRTRFDKFPLYLRTYELIEHKRLSNEEALIHLLEKGSIGMVT